MSGSWEAMVTAEQEYESALERRRALQRMTKQQLIDLVRDLEISATESPALAHPAVHEIRSQL